jgi:extracellular elastinolytic metalloproteinase
MSRYFSFSPPVTKRANFTKRWTRLPILGAIAVLLMGSVLPSTAFAGTIQGIKFNDLNANGIKEPNEPGLPNETILIRNLSQGGLGLSQVNTDASGNYLFEEAGIAGNFRVWSRIPSEWIQTTPTEGTGMQTYDVTISENQTLQVDFGIRDTNVEPLPLNSEPQVSVDSNMVTVEVGTEITLTGSFSDVDNTDTHSIQWNFGDDSTANTLIAIHTYTTVGNYTAILTVTDSQGGTGSANVQVVVNPKPNTVPTVDTGRNITVYVGEQANFSGNFTDPDASDTHSVQWMFGDGNIANAPITTHTYTSVGSYTATLTVTDSQGGIGSANVQVVVNPKPNTLPTVDAGRNITVYVGEQANFNGNFTDPDASDTHSVQWMFGDGSIANVPIATHAYTSVGNYTATLTVTDNQGGVGTDSVQITVNPIPNTLPTVSIDMNSMAVEVGNIAIFSGSYEDADSADTHTVQWNFGDGNTADTLMATHTYESPGNYTVIMTVTDSQGGVGSKTVPIVVSTETERHQNFDARIELTEGISFAPSSNQLLAEQGLRGQSTNLAVTYEKTTGALRSIYNMSEYLSDSNTGNHQTIAINYLKANLDLLGLSESDIDNMELTDSVYSEVTGATHLYWRQTYQQLPLYNAQLNVNVNRDGRVISVNNSFMPSISSGLNSLQPTLGAGDAVMKVMLHQGVNMSTPPEELGPPQGVRQETLVENTGISQEPIKASLMLLPIQLGDVRLVWNFQIITLDGQHAYDITVGGVGGEVLTRFDWVDDASYGVYPFPVESPNHTTPLPPNDARVVVPSPASTSSSPYGWHDTNGVPGAEYTIMRGNNVHAYDDIDGNNLPPSKEPNCSSGTDCLFNLDLNQPPHTYTSAAIANLFYWNNIIHDVMFQYGFDSPSGNFQKNTYGAGGIGNDYVLAEAQDGGGMNNANFYTPPDGSRPRMQMYLWNITSPQRDGDFANGIIIHEYGHGISNRLVGGPNNVSCLKNNQNPGEGISDWLALVYTHEVGDTGADPRGIGTYVLGQPTTGAGIRPQRYSTDPAINNYTYESIKGKSVPHGVGSVWAQALWEVYWALVDEHGFDPDLYNATGDSGNQRMLLYFTEGLKNTACNPTFTDARDGIIQAATDNYSGEDVCLIWETFANFGLGSDAVSGGSNSTNPTNGFAVPPEACATPTPCDSPTIKSNGNGDWNTIATWNTGSVPGPNDTVLIQTNHTVTANSVVVGTLCIETDGILKGSNGLLQVDANVDIYNYGEIVGMDGKPGECHGNSVGSYIHATPGGDVMLSAVMSIVNDGKIKSGPGGHEITHGTDVNLGTTCPHKQTIVARAANGGVIDVYADTIINNGTIGSDGRNIYANKRVSSYGGNGGVGSNSYELRQNCSGSSGGYLGYLGNRGPYQTGSPNYGGYNLGKVYGGNGGNTTVFAMNHLTNAATGRISSGYGGDARAANCSYLPVPGQGGTVIVDSLGTLDLQGVIAAGGDGKAVGEPEIMLSGPNMRIEDSKDVLIFGGENWKLELRDLSPDAITAEDTITLAVGPGGVIDLRGNAAKVLKAGVKVEIFADTVLLDEGVVLEDIIEAPSITTHPNKILYEVTVSGTSHFKDVPVAATIPIDIRVLNSGPTTDTYTLTVNDSKGWQLGTLPDTITVEGLQLAQLELNVTTPTTPVNNIITVVAASQSDSSVSAKMEIMFSMEGATNSPYKFVGPYTVSGQIFDELDKPIAEVAIQIDHRTTVTDDTGYWEIVGLDGGNYTVVASKDGYTIAPKDFVVDGENVVLSLEAEVISKDNSTASGTILDEAGNPMANVTIKIGDNSATTGPDGTWKITDLATGDYTATASKVPYQFQPQNFTVDNDENAIVTFKPIGDYSAFGTMIDKLGNPMEGVTVQIGDTIVTTDKSGNWQITDLQQGEYTAIVNKDGYAFAPVEFELGNDHLRQEVAFPLVSNLAVNIVAEPRKAQQGENVTYTITVMNGGGETATGVVLSDILPENVNLLSMKALDGGNCDVGTVSCNLPDLTTGNYARVKLVISNEQGNWLENRAQVVSNEYPTDVAEKRTNVIPHLSVDMSCKPKQVAIQNTLQCTALVELSSLAPTTATGVQLVITAPDNVELKSIDTDYGVCDTSEWPTVICSMTDLSVESAEATSTVTVDMDMLVIDPGLLVLKHEAKVSANEYGIYKRNARNTIFVDGIKVDLAFVIDVTGSMQGEINGVIKALNDAIAEIDANNAPLIALVTFRDEEEVELQALTSDLDALLGVIEKLKASGGGTCHEASVEALNLVIPHVKDGGSILFATDASAYPDADIDAVIEQLRAKSISFNGMITGDCTDKNSWNDLQ